MIRYFLLLLLMYAIHGLSPVQANPSDDADSAFKKADTELNRVYKELVKAIKKQEAREYFIRSQRAWIVFRDEEASFRTELYNKGGIVWACVFTEEQTELTNERIKQIKSLQSEYQTYIESH